MKNPPLPRAKLLLAALAASAAAPLAAGAVTPAEWQYRQEIEVSAPGVVKLAVPPATYDVAQPNLADLRILDPDGREVASLLDQDVRFPERPEPPRPQSPASFTATSAAESTELLIVLGARNPLVAIDLETSTPFFLKAAHVEVSEDGRRWASLGPAIPLFRQFGAEQLRIPLDQRRRFEAVRVTLDDVRSRPIEFSGAKMILARPTETAPRPETVGIPATITRRDEFAGETVLTVALPARQLPLAALAFDVKDPLFMRRVSAGVRDVADTVSAERTVANGNLYRVSLPDAETRANLDLPIERDGLGREVLVHIHNGDSPPLTVEAVSARVYPVHLLFHAPVAGRYILLSGNPQASAPRYDLAAFSAELRRAAGTPVEPGPVVAVLDYRPRAGIAPPPMPEVPLTGATLEARAWPQRRSIQLELDGVQELELDLSALAGSRSDLSDLRLLRADRQIPYLIERPKLSRALALQAVSDPDPKRPRVSRWRIALPHPGLPLQRLILGSPTTLFSRHFRVYERTKNADGREREALLDQADWHRTPEPGAPETRVFELRERLRSDTLWIETDNGDNPPIELTKVQAAYPVVRLIFKTAETDGFALLYGNAQAVRPSYDLRLVAPQLLTAPRHVARLAAPPAAPDAPVFAGIDRRFIFWGVLAFVVVALLAVVAKLLPKPPPT